MARSLHFSLLTLLLSLLPYVLDVSVPDGTSNGFTSDASTLVIILICVLFSIIVSGERQSSGTFFVGRHLARASVAVIWFLSIFITAVGLFFSFYSIDLQSGMTLFFPFVMSLAVSVFFWFSEGKIEYVKDKTPKWVLLGDEGGHFPRWAKVIIRRPRGRAIKPLLGYSIYMGSDLIGVVNPGEEICVYVTVGIHPLSVQMGGMGGVASYFDAREGDVVIFEIDVQGNNNFPRVLLNPAQYFILRRVV